MTFEVWDTVRFIVSDYFTLEEDKIVRRGNVRNVEENDWTDIVERVDKCSSRTVLLSCVL